jgi:putative hydrolase of the HAD superfamily
VSNAQFFTPLLFPALLKDSAADLGFQPDLTAYSFERGSAKPGTQLFEGPLAALAEQGIDSSHVAYVGNDMRNDVKAAAAVGCMTILFAGDTRSLRLRQDEVTALPDTVVQSLPDVPAVVGLR